MPSLLPGRDIGAVSAAFPGAGAVVDHPVGQEGIVAGDLADTDIALGGSLGIVAQDAVDLAPSPGRDRPAGDRRDQQAPIPVVDVDGEDTLAVVDFSGIDQGQVAAALPVLLKALVITTGPVVAPSGTLT